MKKLLLFDFDGVLCDSLHAAIHCVELAAKEIGATSNTVTPEAIAALESVTFPEIGRLAGISPEQQPAFAKAVFNALRSTAEECHTFAGIPDALSRLAESHTLGVVTANHPEVVSSVLSRAGVLPKIGAILGGDIPGHKAEKIVQLMQQFQVAKELTWMVGDSRSDISEGKKAGVNTLAVTWGWQSKHSLAELQPTAIADSVETMISVLE